MKIVFTALAECQIERLYAYISEHASEGIADGYIGRIVAYCQSLEHFPLRGNRRDDLLPGLRTIGFERRATIAFMVIENAVVIEGIFYGGQNFETVFRGED